MYSVHASIFIWCQFLEASSDLHKASTSCLMLQLKHVGATAAIVVLVTVALPPKKMYLAVQEK